jgi:hypothetical protein
MVDTPAHTGRPATWAAQLTSPAMAGVQRWEYLTLEALTDGRGMFVDRLNELGRHGWEAVGFADILDERHVEVRYPVIILKRPLGHA